MKPEAALKLFTDIKAAEEAPGEKPEFESLSEDEKFVQLGSRIANITTRDPNFNHNFRRFRHVFANRDGTTASLEIDVHYEFNYEVNDIFPGSAFDISAQWVDGNGHSVTEQARQLFFRDNSPEVNAHILSRLEESVTAAEMAYALVPGTV